MRSLINTAFSVFLTFVLVLVGARFFALLVDANRDSEIVERIYRHSDFWVKPFLGMLNFENETVAGGGVFEPASLIAFLVYLIGGMIVLALLGGTAFHRLTHA